MRGPTRWGMVMGMLCACLAGCMGSIQDGAEMKAAITRKVEEPRPESEVKQDGKKTLAYWMAINDVTTKQREIRSPQKPDVREAIATASEQMAHEVEELPILGVDLEAVTFGGRVAGLMRTIGPAMQKVRWYHGLGWPIPQEMKEFTEEAKDLQEEMKALRVTLSRRYKLEFPQIELPPN